MPSTSYSLEEERDTRIYIEDSSGNLNDILLGFKRLLEVSRGKVAAGVMEGGELRVYALAEEEKHAEEALLEKVDPSGRILLVTHRPCLKCAKLILEKKPIAVVVGSTGRGLGHRYLSRFLPVIELVYPTLDLEKPVDRLDILITWGSDVNLAEEDVATRAELELSKNDIEVESISCSPKGRGNRVEIMLKRKSDLVKALRILESEMRGFRIKAFLLTFYSSRLDEIARRIADLASRILPEEISFAVRVNRLGSHPFTSKDLERAIGSLLLTKNRRVDLKNPDATIFVEVFDKRISVGIDPIELAERIEDSD